MHNIKYCGYTIVGSENKYVIREDHGGYKLDKINFTTVEAAKRRIDQAHIDDALKKVDIDIKVYRNHKTKAWFVWDKDSDFMVNLETFEDVIPYIKGLIK